MSLAIFWASLSCLVRGLSPVVMTLNIEGENFLVPNLVRVVLGQVLGHGVPLIICPDLLLVTVNSRMRGKSRLSSISHLANVAGPGVVGAGSQVTGARAGHAAVREQTPGEVGAGQEGARKSGI